jgi:hypothetical protein
MPLDVSVGSNVTGASQQQVWPRPPCPQSRSNFDSLRLCAVIEPDSNEPPVCDQQTAICFMRQRGVFLVWSEVLPPRVRSHHPRGAGRSRRLSQISVLARLTNSARRGCRIDALRPATALLLERKFACRIKLICPVQTSREKYSAFAVGQIISTSSPVSRPHEGRLAIVTDVGRGMRWTRTC